MNQFKIK